MYVSETMAGGPALVPSGTSAGRERDGSGMGAGKPTLTIGDVKIDELIMMRSSLPLT